MPIDKQICQIVHQLALSLSIYGLLRNSTSFLSSLLVVMLSSNSISTLFPRSTSSRCSEATATPCPVLARAVPSSAVSLDTISAWHSWLAFFPQD